MIIIISEITANVFLKLCTDKLLQSFFQNFYYIMYVYVDTHMCGYLQVVFP